MADHDCRSNMAPSIDAARRSDQNTGELLPILSAAISEDGLTVFMECRVCGSEFDVTYEQTDIERYNPQ